MENGCPEAKTSTERLNSIGNYLTAKEEHASVVTYEWMDGAPIGIHYGRYNQTKGGIYLHLNVNSKAFSALQSNSGNAIPDHPEVNFGVGWTKHIVKSEKVPVWVTFGPGVTMKGFYGRYDTIDKNSHPDEHGYPTKEAIVEDIDKEEGQKFNAGVSINPEIGICVKYSYFAARVGYSYRFALDSALKDFLGQHNFSIGIGFAF